MESPLFHHHRLIRRDSFFYVCQFIFTHRADLADSKQDVSGCKRLKILITDFFRRLRLKIAARTKHLVCMLFHIDSRYFSKFVRCLYIQFRAGRRTKQQRIRNNRGTQQTGNRLCNFDAVLLIHLPDNRRCASHRLIAEHHRHRRFQTSDFMMIDNT